MVLIYRIFFKILRVLKIDKYLSDSLYLKLRFKIAMKKSLRLSSPSSFNEKIQWLKLHDRKPEYTMMVDKYKVREYVASKLGDEYLIPLIGVWDNPDEINFSSLPNKFVLKCNHNSGQGLCICKDKSNLNTSLVREELKKGLSEDFYLQTREWPYKNVTRKIIAESYIGDENQDLMDYKFMCFNGKVRLSFVCSNRFNDGGLNVTFFDLDWNVLPFERVYPRSKEIIYKPKNYDKMIKFAELLAKDIPFVRVDFYETGDKLYFGEITFYPGSGFEKFSPEKWDYILGDWIQLPL